MAYTKIITIGSRLDRCLDYVQNHEKTSLSNALQYTMDGEKTEGGYFESAINCELERAYADMTATKRRWGKTGKSRVQGYHVIQSFAPGEASPEEAHAIGIEFVQNLLGDRYEAVVTTHLDREHLHNHVVFNSVSFMPFAYQGDNTPLKPRGRNDFGENGNTQKLEVYICGTKYSFYH